MRCGRIVSLTSQGESFFDFQYAITHQSRWSSAERLSCPRTVPGEYFDATFLLCSPPGTIRTFKCPIECTAIPDFDVPEKDATKIDP